MLAWKAEKRKRLDHALVQYTKNRRQRYKHAQGGSRYGDAMGRALVLPNLFLSNNGEEGVTGRGGKFIPLKNNSSHAIFHL